MENMEQKIIDYQAKVIEDQHNQIAKLYEQIKFLFSKLADKDKQQ